MNIQKTIVALLVMSLVAGSATISIAETEGAQLEFVDLCPGRLSYAPGDELEVYTFVYNTGTETVEDGSITLTVIDPNGTVVYDFDYNVESASVPGAKRGYLNRYLWEVTENATSGKYIIEGVLRWGGDAIMKETFFYVPIEKEQTTPGLDITSLYTSRLLYTPGDEINCICRLKNTDTEPIEYYLSLAIFDQNGTMFDADAINVYSLGPNKTVKHVLKLFDIPVDAEEGMYEITVILWYANEAVSKTTNFPVALTEE